ncbi:hypothetical protein JOM56_009149 [Amanita muscaria]
MFKACKTSLADSSDPPRNNKLPRIISKFWLPRAFDDDASFEFISVFIVYFNIEICLSFPNIKQNKGRTWSPRRCRPNEIIVKLHFTRNPVYLPVVMCKAQPQAHQSSALAISALLVVLFNCASHPWNRDGRGEGDGGAGTSRTSIQFVLGQEEILPISPTYNASTAEIASPHPLAPHDLIKPGRSRRTYTHVSKHKSKFGDSYYKNPSIPNIWD